MLFPDGVYTGGSNGRPVRFTRVEAPSRDELTRLTHTIAQRVGRYLERLCRYITRPAVSMKRVSLTRNGQVRYALKTPWRNGTTHVIFEPLDFMYRMYGMPRAHDCRDAGGRAMPGAIAEQAQERPYPGWFPWYPNPEST